MIATPVAHADLFGFWVKPKVDFVSGTGEVFKRFEGKPAGGLELGLEVLGFSMWADAEFMDKEQFWATANVGYDLSFGDDIELTLGAYLGAVFFNFPEDNGGGSSSISEDQKSRLQPLLAQYMVDYSTFEEKYDDAFGAANKISNTAFGLNGRARVSLEYYFFPMFLIGLQGTAGYHLIMSGEEAAGSTQALAVDTFVSSQAAIPADAKAKAKTEIKDALGVKEIDVDNLKGVNYSLGAFLNFSF
jgi:hypothetical protein